MKDGDGGGCGYLALSRVVICAHIEGIYVYIYIYTYI